jgi:hypothetical protein
MTDEDFAAGVDRILSVALPRTHGAHRALDMLWTRYALEKGGAIADATARWMAYIEGDHAGNKPYPLPRVSWWQRPLACKLGRHSWIDNTGEHDWGSVFDCPLCGAHDSYGNPCP